MCLSSENISFSSIIDISHSLILFYFHSNEKIQNILKYIFSFVSSLKFVIFIISSILSHFHYFLSRVELRLKNVAMNTSKLNNTNYFFVPFLHVYVQTSCSFTIIQINTEYSNNS